MATPPPPGREVQAHWRLHSHHWDCRHWDDLLPPVELRTGLLRLPPPDGSPASRRHWGGARPAVYSMRRLAIPPPQPTALVSPPGDPVRAEHAGCSPAYTA